MRTSLGWTAVDVFGLAPLPERPSANYRRLARCYLMGLVWLLKGRPVVTLTAETAAIQPLLAGSSHIAGPGLGRVMEPIRAELSGNNTPRRLAAHVVEEAEELVENWDAAVSDDWGLVAKTELQKLLAEMQRSLATASPTAWPAGLIPAARCFGSARMIAIDRS